MLNADFSDKKSKGWASGNIGNGSVVPVVHATPSSFPPLDSTYGSRAKVEDRQYVQMEDGQVPGSIVVPMKRLATHTPLYRLI